MFSPHPHFFFCFLAIYFWKKPGRLLWHVFHNLDVADCVPVVKFYPPLSLRYRQQIAICVGVTKLKLACHLTPFQKGLYPLWKCPQCPQSKPAGAEGWGDVERGFPRVPSRVMDVGCYLDWPLSLCL